MIRYYDRLTAEQKNAYAAIKTALEQKTAYANARVSDGFVAAYEAVVFDYPLCCVSHHGVACDYDGRSYAFVYSDADESAFYAKFDRIIDKVNTAYNRGVDMTPYGLYKAIYDVLSDMIVYDFDALKRYSSLSDNNNRAEIMRFLRKKGNAFSPYGALVEKKAVCNGIAKLYKAVCDRLGLPCACVKARREQTIGRGEEFGDGSPCDHLLNVIEIDGGYAFVDLTNGLKTKDIPITVYDFFAVNYAVLGKSFRLLPRDLATFDCSGADNVYFERNKLVFRNIGELRRYLAGYAFKHTNGEVRAYYSGGKVSDDDLRVIAEDILYAHCPPMKWIDNVRCVNGFITCAITDR